MASSDAQKIVGPVEGFLCIDPTDLTAAFPHGGTAIGTVRDEEFRPGPQERAIFAEEYGVNIEVYHAGWDPVFLCVLRDYDDDAVSAIWPDVTTTGLSRPGLQARVSANDFRAGKRMSDLAVKLLFSPRALDAHKFIVLYKAIPIVQPDASILLNLGDEIGTGVMFRGIPDATGRLFQERFRADLDL